MPVRLLGEEKGGAVVALPGGQRVETRVPIAGLGSAGTLELGVRAEHVATNGGIDGRAEVVERLGDRTFVYARLTDGALVVYEDAGDSQVSVGDPVALAFNPAQVHLFDETGIGHHAA